MSWTVGQSIGGRYKLQRRLGQGGMGEVWQAEDTVLGRSVAVKCTLPHLAQLDPKFTLMLRQETRAASHLFNHPHVVSVLDYVEEAGVPFVVMEFLPGVDGRKFASQYLPKRKDNLTRTALALYVTFCAAKALMHAHEKDIIHRDIKPANLLISTTGQVKLSDFGLAKFAQEATRQVTGKGHGTLLYFAPEQIQGEPGSAETDQYQLGCLLYELLEGKAPFEDEPNNGALAMAKLMKSVPPPSKMNGLLPSEKQSVIEIYEGLINHLPAARWLAYEAVESLARILHRPSWRIVFGPKIPPSVHGRISTITGYDPGPGADLLDFEDPEEALSEALALTLAGAGPYFALGRPGWLQQKLITAARKV
ncbi:serine/threonine-protein kinase [Sorangium sp. So ce321]|uniref:serine/threonine-protein kinase n=1 Tax=Sorangium sp. So ce321 TaxID=3133300 RepID=UPI003F616636